MATLIDWKDDFALGIAEVKFEHREMIDLINELYDSMHDGAGMHEVELSLAAVHSGISAHFALEERLMRKINYREYAAHKADHENLRDETSDNG